MAAHTARFDEHRTTIDDQNPVALQQFFSPCRAYKKHPRGAANDAVCLDIVACHTPGLLEILKGATTDPVAQAAVTALLSDTFEVPTELHAAMQSAHDCGPRLIAMAKHLPRPDWVPHLCGFVASELLSRSSSDWSTVLCTSAMRDGFFIPLAAVAQSGAPGAALASFAAAVFLHTPTVSTFATPNMRDHFLLPLGRQEVRCGPLPFVLRALKRLSACGEGQRILTCKAVRNLIVRYAAAANSRSLIAASAALRKLTGGRKDDGAAQKIFATPTFRDEFFLPLVRVASDDEHVVELASTFANIAAMDPKIFATSAMRDRFFIPLAAVSCVVSVGDAFAGTQRLSEGEFYDTRCAVTSLMTALECTVAREHRSVFATDAMYRHFFVPLAKTAKSVEAVTILLRQFGDLTLRVPAERAIAEEIVTAVAEYVTTPETACATASIVSTHA